MKANAWTIEKVNHWDRCEAESCKGYHLLDICLQLRANNDCQTNSKISMQKKEQP